MTAGWSFAVTRWVDGLVGELDVVATRTDGAMLSMTVFRFPAGWRLNAPGVPVVVRREALRLAKGTGL